MDLNALFSTHYLLELLKGSHLKSQDISIPEVLSPSGSSVLDERELKVCFVISPCSKIRCMDGENGENIGSSWVSHYHWLL